MENSDEYYKMKYFKYKAKYENIKQHGGVKNAILNLAKTAFSNNSKDAKPLKDAKTDGIYLYIQFAILTMLLENKSYLDIVKEFETNTLFHLLLKYTNKVIEGVQKSNPVDQEIIMIFYQIYEKGRYFIFTKETGVVPPSVKEFENTKMELCHEIINEHIDRNFLYLLMYEFIKMGNNRILEILLNHPEIKSLINKYSSANKNLFIDLIELLILNQRSIITTDIINENVMPSVYPFWNRIKSKEIIHLDSINILLLHFSKNIYSKEKVIYELTVLLNKIVNFDLNLRSKFTKPENTKFIIDIIKLLFKNGANPTLIITDDKGDAKNAINNIDNKINNVENAYNEYNIGDPKQELPLIYEIQAVLKIEERRVKEKEERLVKEKEEIQERENRLIERHEEERLQKKREEQVKKQLKELENKSLEMIIEFIFDLIEVQKDIIKSHKSNEEIQVILTVDNITKLIKYCYDRVNTFTDNINYYDVNLNFFLDEIITFNLFDKLVKQIPILEIIKILLYAGANPFKSISENGLGNAFEKIEKQIKEIENNKSNSEDTTLIYKIQEIFKEEKNQKYYQRTERNKLEEEEYQQYLKIAIKKKRQKEEEEEKYGINSTKK